MAALSLDSAIDRAKRNIAPNNPLADWLGPRPTFTQPTQNRQGRSFCTVGDTCFVDTCPRLPIEDYLSDAHGDSLPTYPCVLENVCTNWECYKQKWTIKTLSSICQTPLSLDGGPGFARSSICFGSVTLTEYMRYCTEDAAKDSAPLYVFDPNMLSTVSSSFSIPACFSHDVLAGDPRRSLPPAWLLVGAEGTGTPIHDHPTTIAWNALLSGCKVWLCFPPDVDESHLLLDLGDEFDCDSNDDDDEGYADFDLSAIEWFAKCDCAGDLPETKIGRSQVIIQWPGEVVFLPEGWWHVVLNTEESVAISYSIQLRRYAAKH